jgi:hypothetical protein
LPDIVVPGALVALDDRFVAEFCMSGLMVAGPGMTGATDVEAGGGLLVDVSLGVEDGVVAAATLTAKARIDVVKNTGASLRMVTSGEKDR